MGELPSEEDIKAGYENGELKITFRKEVKKSLKEDHHDRVIDKGLVGISLCLFFFGL